MILQELMNLVEETKKKTRGPNKPFEQSDAVAQKVAIWFRESKLGPTTTIGKILVTFPGQYEAFNNPVKAFLEKNDMSKDPGKVLSICDALGFKIPKKVQTGDAGILTNVTIDGKTIYEYDLKTNPKYTPLKSIEFAEFKKLF